MFPKLIYSSRVHNLFSLEDNAKQNLHKDKDSLYKSRDKQMNADRSAEGKILSSPPEHLSCAALDEASFPEFSQNEFVFTRQANKV